MGMSSLGSARRDARSSLRSPAQVSVGRHRPDRTNHDSDGMLPRCLRSPRPPTRWSFPDRSMRLPIAATWMGSWPSTRLMLSGISRRWGWVRLRGRQRFAVSWKTGRCLQPARRRGLRGAGNRGLRMGSSLGGGRGRGLPRTRGHRNVLRERGVARGVPQGVGPGRLFGCEVEASESRQPECFVTDASGASRVGGDGWTPRFGTAK